MPVSKNPGARSVDVGALLFDSDGVLVDSDASVLHAWVSWARERGLDPSTVVDQVHGRRAEDTVTVLVKGPERDEALHRINDLELSAANEVQALPGALALLRGLDGRPWAVVASGYCSSGFSKVAGRPAYPLRRYSSQPMTSRQESPRPTATGPQPHDWVSRRGTVWCSRTATRECLRPTRQRSGSSSVSTCAVTQVELGLALQTLTPSPATHSSMGAFD